MTSQEQKEWKAKRYEQVSQTAEYKESENKTQFMHNELAQIKDNEQRAIQNDFANNRNAAVDAAKAAGLTARQLDDLAYAWNMGGAATGDAEYNQSLAENQAAAHAAEIKAAQDKGAPQGISPETRAAFEHSGEAALYIDANAAAMQKQYAEEQEKLAEAQRQAQAAAADAAASHNPQAATWLGIDTYNQAESHDGAEFISAADAATPVSEEKSPWQAVLDWITSPFGSATSSAAITPGKENGLAAPALQELRGDDDYPWWDPRGWPDAFQKWAESPNPLNTWLGKSADYDGIKIANEIVPKEGTIKITGGYGPIEVHSALVAAGISVQSQYYSDVTDSRNGISPNGGLGYAQVSNDQMNLPILDDKGRYTGGYGLPGVDQTTEEGGVLAMATRIGIALEACGQCKDASDKIIVAGLAQNGSGFPASAFVKLPETQNGTIDWKQFIKDNKHNPSDTIAKLRQVVTGKNYETELMLEKYTKDLEELIAQGYLLPSEYQDALDVVIRLLE